MLFLSSLLELLIQLLLKILGLCDFPLFCGRLSLPPQTSGETSRVLKTWYPVLLLLSSLWHSGRHCITPSFLHCHRQALPATHRCVLPRQNSSSLQFLMHLLIIQTKSDQYSLKGWSLGLLEVLCLWETFPPQSSDQHMQASSLFSVKVQTLPAPLHPHLYLFSYDMWVPLTHLFWFYVIHTACGTELQSN